MKKTISHIVATSNNYVIGKKNALPWHLPKDLEHFKNYTLNKPIIMGRKTFESIGSPLPQRNNIVVSSKLTEQPDLSIFSNLSKAIKYANNIDSKANEIVIIGGAGIFHDSIKLINKLVMTRINCSIDGDVYYPEINLNEWQLLDQCHHNKDDQHMYDFTIETYIRD